MRKMILLTIVGLIFTLNSEAKRIKGEIFYENDTISVTLKIPMKLFTNEPNYETLQNKVKYFDSSGIKKILKPDQAKEVRFVYEAENIRMISSINSLKLGNVFSNNSNIFLKLEIDGPIKLFNYYYSQTSPGMYDGPNGMVSVGFTFNVEKYVLQKGNGELKRYKGLTFRKDMMEHFKDCPELLKKIENKEFRKNDIESIVEYYNTYFNN